MNFQTSGYTAHEPLIPARLFSLVQDVKTGRHVGKKVTRHNHTFRGLFKCVHCQTAAIAERQKAHVYYRCHTSGCATKSVREEVIDSAVVEALRGVQISTAQAARFTERLTAWLKDRRTAPETGTQQARKKLVDDRLERLTDVLLDGDIDSETYNTKKQSLILEQAELSEKISSAKIGPTDNTIRKFVELMKSLYLTYQIAEPDEKRQIAKLTTSNRLVSGRNAHVQPQNWLMQASTLIATSFGDPDKGSSRTGRDVTDAKMEELKEIINSPKLRLLSEAAFEKHPKRH